MYIDICCITFTLVILYCPNQPFFEAIFFSYIKKGATPIAKGEMGEI
jgi:hypothetical protein